MKRLLIFTGTLLFTMVVFTSFKTKENSQNKPKDKKIQKHIKVIKVDDKGNKTELDTVVENDDAFVWNEDTIDSEHEWDWVSNENLNLDSLHKHFDFKFDFDDEKDGEEKVFVMKSHKGNTPFIHEFRFKDKFPPRPPLPPVPPKMLHFGKEMDANIINLSDPGVVSFKKTKKKDGMEKITIIRKIPDGKDKEMLKEIILHNGARFPEPDIHFPAKKHTVKIIKEDDGTEIIEEEGKVIKIRKQNKGDEKEIEVEVNENED